MSPPTVGTELAYLGGVGSGQGEGRKLGPRPSTEPGKPGLSPTAQRSAKRSSPSSAWIRSLRLFLVAARFSTALSKGQGSVSPQAAASAPQGPRPPEPETEAVGTRVTPVPKQRDQG